MKQPYPEVPRFYVDALGIRTGYYQVGKPNGRPVVLLHGMSTSADSFREALHELSAGHWLLAPDIPGFGFSERTYPFTFPHLVEWLAAFMAALALPPAALVGHSFGGTLVTTFALAYPEDVTRLLLVAPALLVAEHFPAFARRVSSLLGLIDLGSAVSQSSLWVRRQVKAPFYDAARQHDSVWERRLRDYDMARASADVLKATAFHHTRSRLPEVSQPVSLVWGANDPVVPVAHVDELLALFPQSQAHILPACGHVPMLEWPDVFHQLADSFLGET